MFMRRRNAERVEDDVHRTAVLQVRHVLLGEDAGDDALVAVAAGHLVADGQLALDGDVHLHHLDDARRQLVALLDAGDLLAEGQLHGLLGLFEVLEDVADAWSRAGRRRRSPPSTCTGTVVEQLVVEDVALLEERPCPCRPRACPGPPCRGASCAMRLKAESWMTLISSFWSLRSLASSIDSICLARSSFSTPLRREDLGADDGARARPEARAGSCRARRRPSRRRWRGAASLRETAGSRPSG